MKSGSRREAEWPLWGDNRSNPPRPATAASAAAAPSRVFGDHIIERKDGGAALDERKYRAALRLMPLAQDGRGPSRAASSAGGPRRPKLRAKGGRFRLLDLKGRATAWVRSRRFFLVREEGGFENPEKQGIRVVF